MHKQAIEVLERHSKSGTWLFDLESQEIFWSDGVYKLHGVTREQYTPDLDSALSFYTPESRALLESALERAMAEGSGWSLAVDIVRADGCRRHVQAIGQVEQRPGMAPLLAGALLDIHEQTVIQRRTAELERRLAEESLRWQVAGENAGLGLIEINLDQGSYRISGVFAQRIGLSKFSDTEIPRKRWISWIHPDDYAERQLRLEAHMAGETSDYQMEYRLCLPEVGEIWVKEAGRRVEVNAGRRLIGTLSDISQRKIAEREIRHSQRRLRQTLRHAPIGVALVSPQGRWLSVNQALCEIIGYDEKELLESTFQDITHPDDLESDLAQLGDLLAGRTRAYRMEKRYFHKQGHTVDIQLDVSLLRDDAGEPLYFISHIQDITERKRDHQALFEARELAEVTFEAIGEGVIRVDAYGRITDANSAAQTLMGLEPVRSVERQSLIGQPFDAAVRFFDPNRDERMPDPMQDVLRTGERIRVPIFTRLRRLDGAFISIVDSISPIRDEQGGIRGAVFVFQDISEARRMTDELVHQASHDALTGLPNRRGFEQSLASAWKRVRTSLLPAFVMYLDLDHFKIINDVCGHSAGDELLRQIALGFRGMLRETDVLARLGGDEFAAIVMSKDIEGAQTVAEKFIRAARDLDFTFEGRSYAVGVSLGIAELDPSLESTEVALMHADAALYVAKDAGRNRYHVYRAEQAQGATAAAYLDTAQLLQSGLEQNLFTLYLQAIVDADGARIGYEALLRFDGPNGVIGPNAFLPTAKRLGMMSRIDRWVVTEALNLIETFSQRGLWPAHCDLSINLSPVSLADPQFHAELVALLDRRKADAYRLVFEITESDALFGEHYPRLIQQLRDRGFKVWLDDFASGYNSFDMLKRASVDGLKLDRSFVLGIEQDPIDRAVIRSIGDVSAALSLDVTAEGVETPEVFALLRRAGFKRFQGYLFHRPESAEAALSGALGATALEG